MSADTNMTSRARVLGAVLSAALLSSISTPLTAAAPAKVGQTKARFSVDSTIATLAADKRAKAIVDKYAPGLTSGIHYYMAAPFTVREIRSRMSGSLTQAKFEQMQKELNRLR